MRMMRKLAITSAIALLATIGMATGATSAQAAGCAYSNPATQVHYELPFSWESTVYGGGQQNLFACGSHSGVDFSSQDAAATNANGETPVPAVARGRVIVAGDDACHGHYVVIKHPDGFYSAYAHLARIVNGIQTDATVTRGQHIGTVGSTGSAAACGVASIGRHLHLSISSNWSGWGSSDFVDPKQYIGDRNGDGYGGES